jgi:hypothetical protein
MNATIELERHLSILVKVFFRMSARDRDRGTSPAEDGALTS